MNKKERVLATLQHKAPDHTPAGFWLHFPPETHPSEIAIQTHLDFFKDTDVDLCKIMNENLLRGTAPITTPQEYKKLHFSPDWKRACNAQVELIKHIVDKLDGSAAVQATIHGVVVSTHHASLRSGFYVDNIDFFRSCIEHAPGALFSAMQAVSEQLCELARRCVEAGADGIYYAALGGEKDLFTAEQYRSHILPMEKAVFEAAGAGCNTLHICKSKLDIARFAPLPAEIVNWAIHENNPSLEEGFAIFPDKVILGGLDDRAGVLVDGSTEEIIREVKRLRALAGNRPFILGADCTLPTEISLSRIKAAVDACKA